ncbi:hypothetical protein Nmel_007830 [Mimus melanotis]
MSGHSRATQTEWNCPVCHAVHSDTAAVPCGHRFCLGCLLRHSATSATCPQCASPVLSARFSVVGSNDFLQCILTPGGAAPGPRSWARKALFHLVYTRPQPAPPPAAPPRPEPLCPEPTEGFPAELWAELLLGHEHLLDPVRPWLRQSLDAIYGPQWWEARQVESIALSTLCICGPDTDGLTRMLQGYLGEYTAPLIHGLIRVTVQHCRDAWLQWRSRAALQEEGEQRESPTASAGPGLGNQHSEPEPARPAALKALESSSRRALQGLVFLVGNGLGLALALYKCQAMGLLPTRPSDWLAFVTPPQRMEFTGGGLIL